MKNILDFQRWRINEDNEYITQNAIKIEKLLGIKLEVYDDNFEYYLDDEHQKSIMYYVVDDNIKSSTDCEMPLMLNITEMDLFQFWVDETPIPTSLNTEDEENAMLGDYIASYKPIEQFTIEIYKKLSKYYTEIVWRKSL